MSTSDEWLRTQRWIAVGRWMAVVLGLYLTIAIRDNPPVAPGPISRMALLGMTVFLAVYNAVAFFGLGPVRQRSRPAADAMVATFVV